MEKFMIADGVFGTVLKNERFKNNSIKITFFIKPEAKDISALSLVPIMMATGNDEYPNFTLLNRKLDSLYGADVLKSVSRAGDCRQYSVGIRAIGDSFSEDGNLIESARLLASLVFDKFLNNNNYNEQDLQREKRILCEKIRSTLNEKRIYANDKATEIMCEGELYGKPLFGTEETVNAVDNEKLNNAFKILLENATVNIQFCGKYCPDGLFDIFKEKFSLIKRNPQRDLSSVRKNAEEKPQVTEQMDIAQSKLVIGLRANTEKGVNLDAVYTVMNDIFGGGTYSKLFTVVREKMSLCYYCSSNFNRKKGIITVSSGVEQQNVETAKNEILNQFKRLQNGEIEDAEIENSKRTLTGTLKTVNDDLGAITSWYSSRFGDEQILSPEEYGEQIKKVTKEQLVLAANEFSLDTVFVLNPKKGEN